MKYALVTGSNGLIGSEAVRFLIDKGLTVVGIDNDMRKYFFGDEASTLWNQTVNDNYIHKYMDIRECESVFEEYPFELIIHTAAQPSHDWASKEPKTDFSVNAVGTLNLLENYRKYCPKATFIFTSTNKVYGDTPNKLPIRELDTRYECDFTIDETMSIDDSKHSLFGVSKLAADLMVQEYGKYFGLNTGVFRGGCLTGKNHSGTEMHGFLSYLVKCIKNEKPYTIYGYKGKQVRDNIHAYDLVNMFWHYHLAPKQGEVYNVGGGRHSNVSILEAISKIELELGKKAITNYVDENRSGDHIWYISDVSKFKKDYPKWEYTYDINKIIKELCSQ